jgi:hypothetical protein
VRVLPYYAEDNWGDGFQVLMETAYMIQSECEAANQELEQHMNEPWLLKESGVVGLARIER